MASWGDGRGAARLVSLAALALDLLAWNWDGVRHWETTGALWLSGVLIGGLVVAHLPAILRPDRIWLAAGVLWTYGVLAGILSSEFSPFAGLGVALARIAASTPLRIAVLSLLATAVPFGLNAVNTTGEVQATVNPLLVTVPIWAVLAIIPWGVGRASYRAAQHAEERAREREQLKEAEARERLQAERLRLARELHDIVSHSVSAMTLQAAGARALAPDGNPHQVAALEAVEQTGVQAMRELHRLLGLLRAVDEDETTVDAAWVGHESVRDLDSLLESARAHDIEVEFIAEGSPHQLDPSIDHAAYRVVQESLANVVKHGGRAAIARVHLLWHDNSLRIDVRNSPGLAGSVAPSALSSGLGLRGLRERVALAGGAVESGPTGDGGFLVRAELPFATGSIPEDENDQR